MVECGPQVCDPASSYPFFYNPGFQPLEDGWCLFRPQEELAAVIQVHSLLSGHLANTIKVIDCLINKLVLKVALCHVLNHDLSHWPEIFIFRGLF